VGENMKKAIWWHSEDPTEEQIQDAEYLGYKITAIASGKFASQLLVSDAAKHRKMMREMLEETGANCFMGHFDNKLPVDAVDLLLEIEDPKMLKEWNERWITVGLI
jgi:hypothetical protein